tara:strand:+ start:532 stop:1428 length:897 start_codon:yes stop_codon:yes gene_type:complete
MKNINTILPFLKCPITGGNLIFKNGELISEADSNIKFPIVNNVIKFVSSDEVLSYNEHWEKFEDLTVSNTKLQQGEKFVNWVSSDKKMDDDSVILDVGCGDGSHIPYMPKNAIKIALDYSNCVHIVEKRYRETNNLFIIQADAQRLPIKENVIDFSIVYSCYNHLPNLKLGVSEGERVLKKNGYIGIWGYGTDSAFLYHGINFVRWIYHLFKSKTYHTFIAICLTPSLLFVRNSTGIRLGRNNFNEVYEIVSTNLSPEIVTLVYKFKWQDFVSKNLELISEYGINCGQLFKKNNNYVD